jgi:nitrogen fixation protein NifU and related proteins
MNERFDRIDEFILGNAKADYPAAYLDHALRPRNAGNMEGANGFAALSAHDGSAMEVWLRVDNGIIADASFWTEGCGSTIACGSMTTEMTKGKTLAEAFKIGPEEIDAALGGLPGEGCVCAKLAIDTLKAALRDYLVYKNEPWKRKYNRPGTSRT